MRVSFVIRAVVVALVCSLPVVVCATIIASDNASNAPYGDGWQTGDNGGLGMGPWTLVTGGNRTYLVSSSVSNADGSDNGSTGGIAGDGDINTAGVAWGMRSSGGDIAEASRTFNSALDIGGSLSIDFDNGYINGGGTVGFGFQNNATSENMFQLYFVGGTTHYQWVDAGGAQTSTVAYGDEGLTLVLTRTGLDTYSATITRRDGVSQGISGNFGGASNPSNLDQIRLFNDNAGVSGFDPFARDAYFNSILMDNPVTLIPEPSTLLLLLAGTGLLYARRRS